MRRIHSILLIVIVLYGCAPRYRIPKSVHELDGIVIFENIPENSYVFIDGKPVEIRESKSFSVPLKKGSHKIEIFSGGKKKMFFVEIGQGSFVKITGGSR